MKKKKPLWLQYNIKELLKTEAGIPRIWQIRNGEVLVGVDFGLNQGEWVRRILAKNENRFLISTLLVRKKDIAWCLKIPHGGFILIHVFQNSESLLMKNVSPSPIYYLLCLRSRVGQKIGANCRLSVILKFTLLLCVPISGILKECKVETHIW